MSIRRTVGRQLSSLRAKYGPQPPCADQRHGGAGAVVAYASRLNCLVINPFVDVLALEVLHRPQEQPGGPRGILLHDGAPSATARACPVAAVLISTIVAQYLRRSRRMPGPAASLVVRPVHTLHHKAEDDCRAGQKHGSLHSEQELCHGYDSPQESTMQSVNGGACTSSNRSDPHSASHYCEIHRSTLSIKEASSTSTKGGVDKMLHSLGNRGPCELVGRRKGRALARRSLLSGPSPGPAAWLVPPAITDNSWPRWLQTTPRASVPGSRTQSVQPATYDAERS